MWVVEVVRWLCWRGSGGIVICLMCAPRYVGDGCGAVGDGVVPGVSGRPGSIRSRDGVVAVGGTRAAVGGVPLSPQLCCCPSPVV